MVLSGNTLYGVTKHGGQNSSGTIFSYSIGSKTNFVMHCFGSVTDDGNTPFGSLLLISNTLYGTTEYGRYKF